MASTTNRAVRIARCSSWVITKEVSTNSSSSPQNTAVGSRLASQPAVPREVVLALAAACEVSLVIAKATPGTWRPIEVGTAHNGAESAELRRYHVDWLA